MTKVLLIGLGHIGLGLIVPVFQKAGYDIVGTDVNRERLINLENGYILKTPSGIYDYDLNLQSMKEVSGKFDLVVTSVGRQNLAAIALWLEEKNIFAPVLLAENLPDPVNIFPTQIPIVVDRICPRVAIERSNFTAFAEDYYKIVVLDNPLTCQLGKGSGVELASSLLQVEIKRKQKMFTVNLAHVVTALYGQRLGCVTVEEAINKTEINSKVKFAINDIAPWLGFDGKEADARIDEIIKRFSSPLSDPLSRILRDDNYLSALRYIDIPRRGLGGIGRESSTLEEAHRLLTAY